MKTEPTEALKELIQCVFDAYDIEGEDIENIVRYDIAKDTAMKSFKEGQSSPKIKQLGWKSYTGYYSADTHLVEYLITPEYGTDINTRHLLWINKSPISNYSTLEEAKAAAQADFERRVKKCLDL